MGNLFVNLPLVAGIGPGVDTSGMGKTKTFLITPFSRGSVTLEASVDGGVSFGPVGILSPGAERIVVDCAAEFMRAVNRSNATGSVAVASSDEGGRFALLPIDLSGAGTPVDISDFGVFTTVVAGGTVEAGSVAVQVSDDLSSWSTCALFAGSKTVVHCEITARWMRTLCTKNEGNGTFAPSIGIGAINDAGASSFGDPITVEGSANSPGVSSLHSRSDHQHRLGLDVQDAGGSVGKRPAIEVTGSNGIAVSVADDPGNDRVQVNVDGAGAGGLPLARTLVDTVMAVTTSSAYANAMDGGSVSIPRDGDYLVIFEGTWDSTNTSNLVDVGIAVNDETVPVGDSVRTFDPDSTGNPNSYTTTALLTGLSAGDAIYGIFARHGGGSGRLFTRRLTVIEVDAS